MKKTKLNTNEKINIFLKLATLIATITMFYMKMYFLAIFGLILVMIDIIEIIKTYREHKKEEKVYEEWDLDLDK